jgi:hypothetical protein
MSRLHDLKTGVVQKLEKHAARQVGKTMRSLEKRMQNEDPEKMKAFLKDIIEDESFPYEMRQSCKKLLNGYLEKKSPEVVMNEHIAEVASTCDLKQKP